VSCPCRATVRVATTLAARECRRAPPINRDLRTMSNFTEEQARTYMHKLLAAMTEAGGSDLFIAHDFAPSMKAHGNIRPLTAQKLTGALTRQLANAVMNERQREEFAREFECNFAIAIPGLSRFRVNIFIQQQHVGMVVRTIASEMPNFEKLGRCTRTTRTRRSIASSISFRKSGATSC
jgi:hypothetical protein